VDSITSCLLMTMLIIYDEDVARTVELSNKRVRSSRPSIRVCGDERERLRASAGSWLKLCYVYDGERRDDR
jgi:hypothetical protein